MSVQREEKADFPAIERKWRAHWEKSGASRVETRNPGRPKYYCLDMFPYPSGSGLHVGHWRGYVISDVIARLMMMRGFEVLHPMGWDSFGLPAENAAIKQGVHPAKLTADNIGTFRRQLEEIGSTYDWDRSFATSDPAYYRWTQWIFLRMFEAGLAYRKEVPINWCPSCQTGLANEDVEGGACERCGTTVERRSMKQWIIRITDYADRLLADLKDVDWPESVKRMQEEWIGRSEGARVTFPVVFPNSLSDPLSPTWAAAEPAQAARAGVRGIDVFTTRLDTIYGATYVVLAPEHPLVEAITTDVQRAAVKAYVEQARGKSDLDRQKETKEKSGVATGAFATNPFSGETIPIWIGDYVLAHYGTGAIMCVPAHDQRDFEFARTHGLPIREVVAPGPSERATARDRSDRDREALPTGHRDESGGSGALSPGAMADGFLISSGPFTGLDSATARREMAAHAEKQGFGKGSITYRLQDWVFARQRYWGEPIPIVHCAACGPVAVPDAELPVKLPEVEKYQPSGTGESPLATIREWVETTCPRCKGPGRRETDTMPQWAGSSWYFLRYPCPDESTRPWDPETVKAWMPVDLYVGGVEHATRHLIYARFYCKFLFDKGHLPFQEPFRRLFNQGIIYRHGAKMSKSKGNVVSPDELVENYGADTLRLFELFIGPSDQTCEWSDDGIEGCYRFLKKVWRLVTLAAPADAGEVEPAALVRERHRVIKTASERLEKFQFNTTISLLMEYANALGALERVSHATADALTRILAPMAPHVGEELNARLGHAETVFRRPFPEFDPTLAAVLTKSIPIQINGKVRGTVDLPAGADAEAARAAAQENESAKKYLEGKTVVKFVFVQDKILNFVVKE